MRSQQGGNQAALQTVEQEPMATVPLVCPTQSPSAGVTLREGVRRLRAATEPDGGLRSALAEVGIRQSYGMAHTVRRAAVTRKLQKVIAVLGAVIAVSSLGFLQWANTDPEISIPAQVLPVVNARDTLEEAWTKSRRLEEISEVFNKSKSGEGTFMNTRVPNLPAILAENDQAFGLIRRALTQAHAQPRATGDPSHVDYARERLNQLGRLLALKANHQLESGAPNSALATAVDTMHMAEKSAQNGNIFSRSVSSIVERYGRNVLWRLVDRVDSKSARSAIDRLVELDANRSPLSTNMREQMVVEQAHLLTLFKRWDWRTQVYDRTLSRYDSENIEALKQLGGYSALLRTSKRNLMAEFTQAMEQQIARAGSVPTVGESVGPWTYGTLGGAIAPNLNTWRFANLGRSIVQNRMLVVELALRAYYLDNGRYPTSLVQLQPSYLKSLPRDPFRPAEPLTYALTSKGPLVYSVGPDGIDQGGRAIKRDRGADPVEPILQPHSTGDIVARINKD